MARKTEVLLDNLCFGEGPRWHDGKLWLSDMYDYKILSVDVNGGIETVLEVPQQPSGLGWLPNGELIFVSMLDRRVMRLGSDGLTVHADLSELVNHPCNDMAVDGHGNAFVGNFGFDLGAVVAGEAEPKGTPLICVSPNGESQSAGGPLMFPNGTVITPDGRTLIVAETFGLRLTAFDLSPSGQLTNGRLWADLKDIHPDGIALDAEGAIWVSAPGTNAVHRVAEGGEILETIELTQDSFACVLGGDDGKTLFILTATTFVPGETQKLRSGKVEQIKVDVPAASPCRPG